MKKDISRQATERAAVVLSKLQGEMRERFFTGPNRVQMTPAEFRRAFQRASPEERSKVIDLIPEDQLLRLIIGRK